MLARIRKAKDNEGGFTLIELLVVIIIIGILAAIAIPTFLNQRKKGWQAAMKADINSATVAEESFATDNNGTYTADIAALRAQGFNPTARVTVTPALVTGGFTLTAVHADCAASFNIVYNSTTGTSTPTGTC